MFCRFCGRKIIEGSLFCPYCGKRLTLQDPEAPPSPPQTEQVPAAPETPPAYTPPTSAKTAAEQSPAPASHSQSVRWAVLAVLILLLIGGILTLFMTKVLCFHTWTEATCTRPETCARCFDTRAASLGHSVSRATCTKPAICTRCGTAYGTPLGHDVKEPTCTNASVCRLCTTVLEKALGHIWTEETFSTPKTCERCGSIRPMTQPATGTVYIEASKYCGSKLTFHAASDYNSYVKLKDEEGSDIIAFYVRAGETAEIKVPGGKYYIYFAHGKDWYGPEHDFGENTYYQKDVDALDFYNYTWEYTIDAGPDGNAETTTIEEDQF